MLELGLIFAIVLFNFCRDRGIIPKPFTSMLSGVACVAFLYAKAGLPAPESIEMFWASFTRFHIEVLVAVSLGIYTWCLKGWGKYFSCFHGRDSRMESEIKWIDSLGYRFFPPVVRTVYNDSEVTALNRRRGLFCMTLRGGFMIPAFIALALVANSFFPLAGIICGPAQGPCYSVMRYVKEKNAVKYGALLHGLVMGCGFAFVLACLSHFV